MTYDTRHYTSGEGATPEERADLERAGVPVTVDTVRALRVGISTGYLDGFEYGRSRANAGNPDRI